MRGCCGYFCLSIAICYNPLGTGEWMTYEGWVWVTTDLEFFLLRVMSVDYNFVAISNKS